MPAGGKLTSNQSVESDRLGDKDSSASLELDEPLSRLAGPGVALVALLAFELLSVGSRNLERLKVVGELDLLVESLLLGVVAMEQLGLCEGNKEKGKIHGARSVTDASRDRSAKKWRNLPIMRIPA